MIRRVALDRFDRKLLAKLLSSLSSPSRLVLLLVTCLFDTAPENYLNNTLSIAQAPSAFSTHLDSTSSFNESASSREANNNSRVVDKQAGGIKELHESWINPQARFDQVSLPHFGFFSHLPFREPFSSESIDNALSYFNTQLKYSYAQVRILDDFPSTSIHFVSSLLFSLQFEYDDFPLLLRWPE